MLLTIFSMPVSVSATGDIILRKLIEPSELEARKLLWKIQLS